jgi:hypothetical protein
MSLHPWERPETEFPAVVPVGTLLFDPTSPISAVAVTGVLAYRNGFEFFVTRLVRNPPGWVSSGAPHPGRRHGPSAQESFQIGVEFANGGQTPFTGGFIELSYPEEPDRPFMHPCGSSIRWHREDDRRWVWPLPPPGRLTFICRLGDTESRVGMDAQLILDASRQSQPAWPRA